MVKAHQTSSSAWSLLTNYFELSIKQTFSGQVTNADEQFRGIE